MVREVVGVLAREGLEGRGEVTVAIVGGDVMVIKRLKDGRESFWEDGERDKRGRSLNLRLVFASAIVFSL